MTVPPDFAAPAREILARHTAHMLMRDEDRPDDPPMGAAMLRDIAALATAAYAAGAATNGRLCPTSVEAERDSAVRDYIALRDEAYAARCSVVALEKERDNLTTDLSNLTIKHKAALNLIRVLRKNKPMAVLKALVDTLPKCTRDSCDQSATKAYSRGGERFCDSHGRGRGIVRAVPDYPRAKALRRAISLLRAL